MKRLLSVKVATLVLAFGMFVLGARRPLSDCLKCKTWGCALCVIEWIFGAPPPQPTDGNKTQLELAE